MRQVLNALVLLIPLLLAASAMQTNSLHDALAADLPIPSRAGSDEPSMHGYGDTDKTCQEWTDGCRSCSRGTDSEPTCPNIGPACQPTKISCSKRTEAPKTDAPK